MDENKMVSVYKSQEMETFLRELWEKLLDELTKYLRGSMLPSQKLLIFDLVALNVNFLFCFQSQKKAIISIILKACTLLQTLRKNLPLRIGKIKSLVALLTINVTGFLVESACHVALLRHLLGLVS